MKKMLAWFLAGCLLLGLAPAALAEQADGMELTLQFAFGERTGRYTGTLSGGIPGGNGSFVAETGDEIGWTYTGSWSGGHMEGYGATVREDGRREEGMYSGDYLNGEAAEFDGDKLWRKGTYVQGELVNGQICDDFGNPYFEGEFEDNFLVESAAQRTERLTAFLRDAVDFDYKKVWADYDQYIGQKVLVAGKVSYVWERENPAFQEFSLDVNNDPDRWADVFGYMSKGEKKLVLDDSNVLVFGVVLDKYVWEENGKKYERPHVQFVAVERSDFPAESLSFGDKGKAVKALQTRLKELGYLSGEVDGGYGKGTKQSVASFQEANGLPADGIASLGTLYVLNSDGAVLSSP